MPAQPGRPLQHLPPPALSAILARLQPCDHAHLRLAGRPAQQLVDEHVSSLQLRLHGASADDLRAIHARFPSVTHLKLNSMYAFHWRGTAAEALEVMVALGQLMGPHQWPAIRSLHFDSMPYTAVEYMVRRCPYVQECITDYNVMGTESVLELARCKALMHLQANLGVPSSAALTAALSMSRLTKLDMMWDISPASANGSSAGKAAVAWDFRSMVALQQLSLRGTYQHQLNPRQQGFADELQRCKQAEEQVYSRMRLPGSLTKVQLDRLPARRLPQLAALHRLELQRGEVTDAVLGKLASSCPALQLLVVDALNITAAAHSTPLLALDRLCVTCVEGHLQAGAAVRLASVFPALDSLMVDGTMVLEEPEVFFDGAAQLRHFSSMCGTDGEHFLPGASLPEEVFGPMAALEQLRSLHLNAEPAHVRGVQQLTQLTSLAWAVDERRSDTMFGELRAAFATCKAPPGLQEVEVYFPIDRDAVAAPHNASTACMVVATNALVTWLASAPVAFVRWESDGDGPAAMNKKWLAALSKSSNLEAMLIDINAFDPAPKLLEMACKVARRRGISIQIDACGRFHSYGPT